MVKIAAVLMTLLGAAAGPEVREGWFRIEIPGGAPVTGVFLGRGSTWAGAKVDLDGDGKRETTLRPDPEGGPPFALEIERSGRTFRVEIDAGFVADDLRGAVCFHWSVAGDSGFAFFAGGLLRLGGTAEEAARAPVRLGGPFRFGVSAGIRGPDPVLRVRLTDGNGACLSTAEAEGKERRIRVRLLSGAGERFAGEAGYG